jgi:EAL domain-containing protein (putative c-di-GMP-specific phosphodiesterase class I)
MAMAVWEDGWMMGFSEREKEVARIGSIIEQRADGVYQARLGETVLRSAFQPIIEVTGDGLRVSGYEALIRPYRDGCAIPIETFFAEVAPDETMLVDRLCRTVHYRNFATFGPKDASLLINVDPAAYGDLDLTDETAFRALKCLTASGLTPDRAIYEIVERPSTDERTVFAIAARLRSAGVRIAVDDFGGQALDFSRLAMLRPDLVKIDGSVLRQARAGGPQLKQLNRLCQVVDRFGIDLLIEGVETTADLETCRQLNPRYLQGYNFGRPVKRPLPAEYYAGRLARAQMLPAGGVDEKPVAATA